MLNQALEIFKKEYDEKGDSLILDSYIPADGTYVIVKPKGGSFEVDEIIDIKLNKEIKDIDRTNKYIPFICFADYNSNILTNNKPIDNKMISSNNYLSFFIKKDNIANKKLSNEIIDRYYDSLEDLHKKYSEKTAEIYRTVEKEIGLIDKEKLNKIRAWIKENIFNFIYSKSEKNYLKVFFLYSYEEYEKEVKRYLIPKVYAKNDYNNVINDTIYGLPNDNMGLNSKKPYLGNNTRKETAPYLISQKEVLLQKKFFDYLLNQSLVGRNNIYMFDDKILSLEKEVLPNKEFKGMYFRIKKHQDKIKTEAEILDFDIISNYRPELIKTFEYKNILEIDYDKLNGVYDTYKTLESMQKIINEILFSKKLVSNYFTATKEIHINDEVLKNNLFTARTALFNWFYKGVDKNIWQLLNKVSLSLVKGSIKNGDMTKVADQFNLRISLMDHFGEEEKMADIIFNIKENLRKKINNKDDKVFVSIEGDREYYFAVGQLVSFFISKSKAKKKPLSYINQFINVNKDKVIKYKLELLFKRYNYNIEGFRFNNIYKMILGYQPDEKVDEDMIIAGYLHSNLLYEKDEEVKK
ncbi:type I-B CRISPR-associated protein Cas8b/Csh1 [Clostridium sp. A1-XYC3]|uniref:Type I-B CRISPR-associated protein Cas8b/Csh1 n=1 Tax=Clostridium tanneri TaxID=3037988 RepID=A0ABU4JXY1_9CLOT|nr:type I-B CRISPR-associated protein Cas8b/Csh1 [Clostridium sp. A1-XYC3]MDW8803035.1 type I-B CRISPR-associated protein Cas8b/Csh1 [Clostridium sp. A1-XYC3]